MSNDPQETRPPQESTAASQSDETPSQTEDNQTAAQPVTPPEGSVPPNASEEVSADATVPQERAADSASGIQDPQPESAPVVQPAETAPSGDATVNSDQAQTETPPSAEESASTDQPTPPAAVADAPPASLDSQTAPSAEAQSNESESTTERVREKMAAVSSASLGADGESAQKRDDPRGGGPVEIPAADDLGDDLEAEISAAMSAPAPSAPSAEAAASPQPAEGSSSSDQGEAAPSDEIVPGDKVEGTVLQIHGEDVFLEAGLRQNVVVSLRQFPDDKPPTVGDKITVVVDEADADGLIKGRLPRGRHRAGGNWDALAEGQVVDCMVSATNKGGLQVMVSNLRAFMPASQIEIGYAGDLEKYVGQKITAEITEVNKKKRNLVVSRRKLLEAERAEGEAVFWQSVEVGQTFTGTVKTIKDYGVFVNIGPVDGFLHIGEISWSRINHPSDVLQDGQNVEVKVLKLDPEKKRISLGMKQLEANPWTHAADKYSSGRTVSGKVTRIADFGAFVELEPGLEGLVHISQLAWRRVGSVSEILSVGDTREFQVQEIDLKRKRVSLSLKALEKRPEPERHREDNVPDEPRPQRKRNPNLRGGRDSSDGGGGLFGNPKDFA